MSPLQTFRLRARTWWRELPAREQRLVGAAGVVIALALTWWVALAPALRTLSTARAAHAQLDIQLQQMLALQAQARALQALPRANREDALRALETSVNQDLGGNLRMQAAGGNTAEGVLVTLRAAPATSFAQWLTQARGNARALPREIHVTRSQPVVVSGVPAAAGNQGNTGYPGNFGGPGGPGGFQGMPPGAMALAVPGGRPPPPGGPVSIAGRAGLPSGGLVTVIGTTTGAEALGARWDGTLVMSLPAR